MDVQHVPTIMYENCSRLSYARLRGIWLVLARGMANHSSRTSQTRPGRLRSRGTIIAWVLWGLSVALLLGILPLLVAVQVAAAQTPTIFPSHFAQQVRLSLQGWFTVVMTPVVILAFST